LTYYYINNQNDTILETKNILSINLTNDEKNNNNVESKIPINSPVEQEQNKLLMEAWSQFLRAMSSKKDEEVELVLGNILEVVRGLSESQVFSVDFFSNKTK
jgi:hypothetical protein